MLQEGAGIDQVVETLQKSAATCRRRARAPMRQIYLDELIAKLRARNKVVTVEHL